MDAIKQKTPSELNEVRLDLIVRDFGVTQDELDEFAKRVLEGGPEERKRLKVAHVCMDRVISAIDSAIAEHPDTLIEEERKADARLAEERRGWRCLLRETAEYEKLNYDIDALMDKLTTLPMLAQDDAYPGRYGPCKMTSITYVCEGKEVQMRKFSFYDKYGNDTDWDKTVDGKEEDEPDYESSWNQVFTLLSFTDFEDFESFDVTKQIEDEEDNA